MPRKLAVVKPTKKKSAPAKAPRPKAVLRAPAEGKNPKKKKIVAAKRKTSALKKRVVRRPRKKLLKLLAPKPVRQEGVAALAAVFEKLKLERFEGNPILEPGGSHWESRATFNPAAFTCDGKIHMFYRAIGDSDVSVLGHAVSSDGFKIDEKSQEPVYIPEWESKEDKNRPRFVSPSGGGLGGSEDPRATLIEGRVYVTYTAYNGYEPPRVALTSIDLEDFRARRWNWEKQVFLSPPGMSNKNWVIFPEKINGKYAVLHSISPEVLIDYFDELDFNGTNFITSQHSNVKARKGVWDSRVRGAGPPPIKTELGWLQIYHAIDDKDPGRYKIGAMILDLKDPTKILYRSTIPLLAPDEHYENDGFKAGVVYTCGAAVADGNLFVYYGGADSVICAASVNLNEFLRALKETGSVEIKQIVRARIKKYAESK